MNQRIKTDPVPEAEYPPRLPPITRVPVVIDGDRFREIDPETGATLGEGRLVRVREPIEGRKSDVHR